MKIIQMKVSSDPDLDTVWKVLTTTGSSPSNFGLTVAYVSIIFSISQNHPHDEQAIAPTIVWGLLTGLASSRRRRSAGENVTYHNKVKMWHTTHYNQVKMLQ